MVGKVLQSVIGPHYFKHSHFISTTKLTECCQDTRSFRSQRFCFAFVVTRKRWKRTFPTSQQTQLLFSRENHAFETETVFWNVSAELWQNTLFKQELAFPL